MTSVAPVVRFPSATLKINGPVWALLRRVAASRRTVPWSVKALSNIREVRWPRILKMASFQLSDCLGIVVIDTFIGEVSKEEIPMSSRVRPERTQARFSADMGVKETNPQLYQTAFWHNSPEKPRICRREEWLQQDRVLLPITWSPLEWLKERYHRRQLEECGGLCVALIWVN